MESILHAGIALPYFLLAIALVSCGAKEDAGEFAGKTEPAPPAVESPWTETNLGPQITTVNVLSGAFGKDENGTDVGYATLYGDPAMIAVVDLATYDIKRVVEFPGGSDGPSGFYAIVFASDGNLYLGSNPNGHLYRYRPGAETPEDLGGAWGGCKFVWDMIEGADGKLYLATYPEARTVEYDTKTGKFHDFGPMVAGEDYVRSIAFDPATGKVYNGIGSHAAMIELDPKTGEKKDILPPEYKEMQFCYSTDVVGGKLVVKMSPGFVGWVMDLKTQSIDATLPGISSVHVSPLAPDGKSFYYMMNADLHVYDLEAKTQRKLDVNPRANANQFAFLTPPGGDHPILMALCKSGYMMKYDPATGKGERGYAKYPRSPVAIQSIILGPDGKIYTSGYLSGGVARYDPITGVSEECSGVGQAEGMTTLGSRIYFGVYPHARISVYDTAQPWDTKAKNPREIFTLGDIEQDRPYGITGVEGANKLFVGTVPGYGLNGGVLAIYDPATDAPPEVHKDLIPNQSIVGLVNTGDKVIGGTSVSGGLGIKPSESEGRLFVWDVKEGKKIYETVPVAGKIAVTGLVVGPDGNVWGLAEGTLFTFDPRTMTVVNHGHKLPVDYSGATHVWRGARMVDGGDGFLYGTVNEMFFRVDVKTKDVKVLGKGLELIARDATGNLYCARGHDLIKLSRQ